MALAAVLCLILGIICGHLDNSGTLLEIFSDGANYILYTLMLLVGVSVGANKAVFLKIKEYHFKILIIPMGITIGSVAGGAVSGYFLGITAATGAAIGSAMGWYSLSGVMITELAGADMGAVAFMSSLIREIITFAMIPFIAKYMNAYTTIAPAAATSEDTTLPMILKYGGAETAVMAVFNGVFCSAMVPFLIKFFCGL